MPTYGTSLGCLDAPHIYNSFKVMFSIPMGAHKLDHAFDIRGDALGTVTIAEGSAGAREIKYTMTLRTDDLENVWDVCGRW